MDWEKIEESLGNNQTLRLEKTAIPGGWLVRESLYATNPAILDGALDNTVTIISTSITFVPDPNYKWRTRRKD